MNDLELANRLADVAAADPILARFLWAEIEYQMPSYDKTV